MKKFYYLLLCGLLYAATISAQTATSGEIPPLAWIIADDVLTISGNGNMPHYVAGTHPWFVHKNSFSRVVIEEGVASIGSCAFIEHDRLISVSISNTVTKIDGAAFLNCVNLPSIHIPASVISIDGGATLGKCYAMTSITVDPANPAFSTDNGFLFDKEKTMIVACIGGKTDNFTIPGTVKTIGKNALSAQLNMTSITIPASVTTFNDFAFSGCTNLSSISLPATLKEIGHGSFSQCTNLAEIINANPEPQTVVIETFLDVDFKVCVLRIPAESYHLYETAAIWKQFQNIVALEDKTVSGTTGTLSWKIVDGVLTISGIGAIPDYFGCYAPWYEYKEMITSVVVDEGVTGIGCYAFHECNFSSIDIPATVSNIGRRVLSGIPLTSISVDVNNQYYTSVNNVLFNRNKTTLVAYPAGIPGSYVIPETVDTIGYNAFEQCRLTSITIPNSVLSIGEEAFYYSGITALSIPASVTSIGRIALALCNNLPSISVDAANPAFVSKDGVLFNKDMTTIIAYPAGKYGDYIIPESVDTIGFGAFWSSKITSITIPHSVLYIGEFAFRYNNNLTSITIPPSVKSIGYCAFLDCFYLTSLVIPASVTGIGAGAFNGCFGLLEIVNFNSAPQILPEEINHEVFVNEIFSTCILRVPAASITNYRKAVVWKNFINIKSIEENFAIDINEMCLLTGATGVIKVTVGSDLNPKDVAWNSSQKNVATVDNSGNVKAINTGTTVITASAGAYEASCTVTVIQPGNSTIKGTVDNAGTSSVRVNLYVKLPDTDTKKGIIGGYVLLATTVPNDNGEYSFENLPEGSYKVDVEIDDYESEATPAINLSDGETRSNINFEVDGATGTVTPKIVTGTVETGHAPSLQIYPNPFTDVVRITVETGRAPSARIQVINSAGAIVHTQTITSPDEIIHLGHLPVGMYFIRLENGQTIKTIKIQ